MIDPVLPTYARAKLSFVSGQGAWLTDDTGRRYLDFGSGIGVNALGHAHPKLVAALKDQADKLWHTSNLYEIPNQARLAELLVEHTFAETVFFANSGTEAMECAVKMARKYFHEVGQPDRSEIITLEGSFHGRTLGMISAAGGEKLVNGFGPLLPGFVHLPFGDHDALKAAVNDRTAAIVIEPVQGEGGIRPVPRQCLKGLRELCDEAGILLILDEIQCGMGRTGFLFDHEAAGITPDIMAIAKGIGGGFPLGACLATERAAKGMTAGSHGSTFGGNPLACAVGCAVLEEVATPEFLSHVRQVAGHFRQRLEALVSEFGDVFDSVRGEGLMLGLVCKAKNMDVIEAGYSAGILTVPAADNVVRILPPLTITIEEVEDGIRRLSQAAQAVKAVL